jgi:hypothetical protein
LRSDLSVLPIRSPQASRAAPSILANVPTPWRILGAWEALPRAWSSGPGRRAVLLRWNYLSQAGWTHTGPDTIGALNAATGLRPACTILDEPHRGAAGDSVSLASSATSSCVKTTLFPPPHREVLTRVLLARGGTGVADRHGAGARQATITPAGVCSSFEHDPL